MLDSIRIVLVAPSHPGNIGAAARAMKTMGLTDLALVSPKLYPDRQATVRAAGADDVLQRALVCDSLAEAIKDCHCVWGASARTRHIPWTLHDPRTCAATIRQITAAHQKVAVVFGRESSGLTNEELASCPFHVHIPTDAAYSSLNLAAAVQVLTYELRMASGVPAVVTERDSPQATSEQVAGLVEHFVQAATLTRFLHPDHPGSLERRLTRVFQKSDLEVNEVNILRGFLASVAHKCSNE